MCYRLLFNPKDAKPQQFKGWPIVIDQLATHVAECTQQPEKDLAIIAEREPQNVLPNPLQRKNSAASKSGGLVVQQR
jgi:hypothetical protein